MNLHNLPLKVTPVPGEMAAGMVRKGGAGYRKKSKPDKE